MSVLVLLEIDAKEGAVDEMIAVLARTLVDTSLAAGFTGEERHMRRLAKIDVIENRFLRDDR